VEKAAAGFDGVGRPAADPLERLKIAPQPTFEAVQTSDRPGWKGDLRQRAIPA